MGGIFENGQDVGGLLFVNRRVVEDLCDNAFQVALYRFVLCVSLNVFLAIEFFEKKMKIV